MNTQAPEIGRTSRGAASRARIVGAAAELMHVNGVANTSVDEVLAASHASKSQLYHYFADKDDLVLAVVERQVECVLAMHESLLSKVTSAAGLRKWRDAVVRSSRECGCAGGCPLGSLVSELAERPRTRALIAQGFARWEGCFVACFEAIRDPAKRIAKARLVDFATTLMAALQGGLLLAQATRSTRPLELSLDAAIAGVLEHLA